MDSNKSSFISVANKNILEQNSNKKYTKGFYTRAGSFMHIFLVTVFPNVVSYVRAK